MADKKEKPAAEPAQEVQEEAAIIMPDIPDNLNPASPNFDKEAYKKVIEEAGGIDAMGNSLTEAFRNISKNLQSFTKPFIEGAQSTVEAAKMVSSLISDIVNTDAYQVLKSVAASLQDYAANHREELEEFQKFYDILDSQNTDNPEEVIYYIGEILDERGGNLSLSEFIAQIKESGQTLDAAAAEIVEEAKKRAADAQKAADIVETIEGLQKELPQIIANPPDKIDYPLDKPNSTIWNLVESTEKNGQISFEFLTGKKGSNQDSIIYCTVNFDELGEGLKITKQLTPFDKRTYQAAAALFNAGNSIMSATQIYSLMGNRGKPKSGDIKKINESLTKMGKAHLFIDNIMETTIAKGYQHFQYDASLLPFERISAYINGQLTESAIHLFREPPLITFAKERKQITTISKQLLESPVNKTNDNLLIDNYLLERIGHMKNPKSHAPRKMLFSTIYEQCLIKTQKQKQRAPEKIKRYLDHYKKCKWIKGYEIEADGIRVFL